MILEYFDTQTKVIGLVIALVIVLLWMRSGPTMRAPGGNGRRISRNSFQKKHELFYNTYLQVPMQDKSNPKLQI
ncbi:unnamed protein product [Brassica rapa subsp. trilocularis]